MDNFYDFEEASKKTVTYNQIVNLKAYIDKRLLDITQRRILDQPQLQLVSFMQVSTKYLSPANFSNRATRMGVVWRRPLFDIYQKKELNGVSPISLMEAMNWTKWSSGYKERCAKGIYLLQRSALGKSVESYSFF